MKLKSLALGVALAFPMAMMAHTGSAMNNSANNNWNNKTQATQSDHAFLHKLATEDQSEINLARLALQKSNNPQVRQYAQSKILKADPAMEEGAKTVAQKENMPITATVPSRDQQEYQKLSKLSGTQFDHEYMRYEAWKQHSDLNTVQHEASTATNPQVKDYAQAQVSPVRDASQSAEHIASSMGEGLNHTATNQNPAMK
jgi:putative membrane protein